MPRLADVPVTLATYERLVRSAIANGRSLEGHLSVLLETIDLDLTKAARGLSTNDDALLSLDSSEAGRVGDRDASIAHSTSNA